MFNKTYTDLDREKARVAYGRLHNVQAVSRELNIPSSNVNRWCIDLTEADKRLADQRIIALREKARTDALFSLRDEAADSGYSYSALEKALLGITFKHLNDEYPPVKKIIKKESEQQRARKLYQEGKTYDEIKEELGVSKSSLSLWCGDLVRDPRSKPKRKISKEFIEEVRAFYESGETVATTADHFKVSDKRITFWCEDLIAARAARRREARLSEGVMPSTKKAKVGTSGPQVLTDEMVKEARQAARDSGIKDYRAHAKKYGVSPSTMAYAMRGLTFAHLNEVCPPIVPGELQRVRSTGRPPVGKKKRVNEALHAVIEEAVKLRRENPAKWTYGKIGRWMEEKLGKRYTAGPVAKMLMGKDPSLKELEGIKVASEPRVKMKRALTPREVHEKREASNRRVAKKRESDRALRILIENEDRYERGLAALTPSEQEAFLAKRAKR